MKLSLTSLLSPATLLSMTTSSWSTQDIPDQTGRTAIVTGSNSGIGRAAAKALAAKGARVVLAVRDTDKGETAAADDDRRHRGPQAGPRQAWSPCARSPPAGTGRSTC